MPRGRHRHSPPLHRLLPPLTVAGVSTACAAAAWLVGEPLLVRSLATAAAVVAIVGAVLLRSWDNAAGKQVADLNSARLRDEWRTEERVAELESEADRVRASRGKLEAKLRARRAELARLRNEHAALLRRYATAETERARTLEDRRRLALGAPSAAPELDASPTERSAAEGARPGPVTYRQAATALRHLARNAARQRAAADAVSPDTVTSGSVSAGSERSDAAAPTKARGAATPDVATVRLKVSDAVLLGTVVDPAASTAAPEAAQPTERTESAAPAPVVAASSATPERAGAELAPAGPMPAARADATQAAERVPAADATQAASAAGGASGEHSRAGAAPAPTTPSAVPAEDVATRAPAA
ncbi:hypothetical protein, partial [Streptomyces sp. NPDC057676]